MTREPKEQALVNNITPKSLQKTGDVVELIGLHPYKCTQCDGWHIGHRPGSADIIRKVKKERASRS